MESLCLSVILLVTSAGLDASLVTPGEFVANDRPVIGVLAQEYVGPPWDGLSCIPASYVKFIEAGGGRVVPVHINRSPEYYSQLLDNLNGVLFPGGDVAVDDSGYGRAGKIILEYAIERNRRQDFFPLWGTCNGLEMLVYLAVGENILTHCNSLNQAMPLQFVNASNSRLFGKIPPDVKKYLSDNTTINFHEWCLTPEAFHRHGVSRLYRAMSVNRDLQGLEYISSIEARHYPFYGVQFHPEMNIFEWTTRKKNNRIPHSAEAVRVTQYFADFFVNEARKSKHRISEDLFTTVSIYNYQASYTQGESFYSQIYFFPNATQSFI